MKKIRLNFKKSKEEVKKAISEPEMRVETKVEAETEMKEEVNAAAETEVKAKPSKKKLFSKKSSKKKRFTLNMSIKVQLLVGFTIPVIFVILVGIVSYNKAEQGMISNYEISAQNTIDTQMEYLDFGFSLIRSDMVQIKLDQELQSLVGGTYANDASKYSSTWNRNSSNLTSKSTLNQFINNIYIIPKKDVDIISAKKSGDNKVKGFYEEWAASEEGTYIIKNSTTGWVSSHSEMDQRTGYDPEEYFLSYMSNFPNNAAVIVADISKEAVKESLQEIDYSNGAIIGFITADGKELLVKEDTNDTQIVFSDQEFYQNCKNSEQLDGIKYIKYDGRDYLFIYTISEETGAALVYMVPETKVTASASDIRKVTVVLVLIASIVAVIIGAGIFVNITSSMSSIIKRLKRVAEGDLTIQMKTKGNSEFTLLNRHIANVINNTRRLIQQVEVIANVVSASAADMEKVSGKMESSTAGIIEALEEIDIGVGQQAGDAQECLVQMDSLSQIIESVSENIQKTASDFENTKEVVARSIGTMEVLSGQTKDTIKVTSQVKDDVEILAKKSSEIKKFVEIIAEMAEQTNLLSLNASIEAARAGEAGKGFAVVAEEIRKLADGSSDAADEINKVVASIEVQTKGTVGIAMKAEKTVEEQAKTVDEIKMAFRQISDATQEMIESVTQVENRVKGMDKERAGTLEAISSISAVSEQTSASSSNVFSIAQGQKDVAESLTQASEELKANTEELKQTIAIFKTTEDNEK